ncbi:hypothetical protein LAZ40_11170 [Cereibacter sphaeroides]|uniref:hypothetical protein n=1 Tax=Cereibacter sphaeroides TaxID=1063 RepID=UPI001F3BCB7E|nr:hypothetical protein [Cereibacter sphaeroides]MCE6959613.1 hypothetical protein [Cereibacter sphaeroides]MCE6974527.1 hypothetical protein [Cereibacter sphaeroides]
MTFWKRYRSGAFTQVALSASIGRGAVLGTWASVEAGAVIGSGTIVGDWSTVGRGAVVGHDVVFGPWAKVGAGAEIGDGVRLGSHTIVQPGVIVPAGAVFDDGDLVTPQGVIADRTGGFCIYVHERGNLITSPFGRFLLAAHLDPDQLIDDFEWGRSEELERYREDPVAGPEAEHDPAP